jgi:hypothetical protein
MHLEARAVCLPSERVGPGGEEARLVLRPVNDTVLDPAP